jgi:hypothetical protein
MDTFRKIKKHYHKQKHGDSSLLEPSNSVEPQRRSQDVLEQLSAEATSET